MNWLTAHQHYGEASGRARWFQRRMARSQVAIYISDRDGGMSNKQIALMANAITGQQQRRSYDDNWAIVMGWMDDRANQQEHQQ